MLHVELADTMIRLLDSAVAWDIDVHDITLNAVFDFKDKTAVPDKIMICMRQAAYINPILAVRYTMQATIQLARDVDADLPRLIRAKHEYNKQRADHKREARAAKGGKKI